MRRVKLMAGGLLVFAAAVYLGSFMADWPGVGFVRAGSEAAMVGGLADWFAVTALFRHPLGLPIPHTALVPRKKDELATKLGDFVTEHFLTRESVLEHVTAAGVVPRVGAWIAEPATSRRLAKELSYNASALLGALEDEAVVDYVLELLRLDAQRRPWAPVLGRFLDRAVDSGAHRPIVDLVAWRLARYLDDEREAIVEEIKQWLRAQGFTGKVAAQFDSRIRGLLDYVVQTLRDVPADAGHARTLRLRLDGVLHALAAELRYDPTTAAKVHGFVLDLIGESRPLVTEIVSDAKASVRESLADPEGVLQSQVSLMIQQVGGRAQHDPEFRARAEAVVEGVVDHVVDRYGSQLTELIRTQVQKWDAPATSRRIELAVGRDLQFIRINGTVVGALAGIAIHALSLPLG